jgi:hypothetical protein
LEGLGVYSKRKPEFINLGYAFAALRKCQEDLVLGFLDLELALAVVSLYFKALPI